MTIELTIVMPCLNEAETLADCIQKAQRFLKSNDVTGEIIIADNGSTDGSQQIAELHGARLVNIPKKGYGNALKGGIEVASGTYIIMGDADDSYDFEDVMPYVIKLREGHDLVMGNRFKGGIKPGAMPFLHKYLGNPVLSFLGRLFYSIKIGDFHCGLRGFSKEAYHKMDLRTTGMEFASEMIVKSKLNGLKIVEVPTVLHPDGRSRRPHLKTWSDGWRHLRFLVLYSPHWLFLIPSIVIMCIGLVISILLISQPVMVEGIIFDIHTLMYSSGMVLIGFQLLVFYALTKIFAVENGLLPKSDRYNRLFKYINLEKGLIIGVIFLIVGFILSYKGLSIWKSTDYGMLQPTDTFRVIIPAVFTILLGVQVILFSLFFSILGLKNTA